MENGTIDEVSVVAAETEATPVVKVVKTNLVYDRTEGRSPDTIVNIGYIDITTEVNGITYHARVKSIVPRFREHEAGVAKLSACVAYYGSEWDLYMKLIDHLKITESAGPRATLNKHLSGKLKATSKSGKSGSKYLAMLGAAPIAENA